MSVPRLDRALLPLALTLVAVVAGPLVFGRGVDLPDDALYYGVASWEWLAHAARTGLSPFWVPGKLGGVSLFADVTPLGPFTPWAWAGRWLPVVPALGATALLHALGTLLAVRWLTRLHGVGAPLATLAGAAVAAGPLGVWAAIDFQVDAWPTFLGFPLVLGCLHRSADAREAGDRAVRARFLALGAGAVAMILLGSHLRIAVAAGAALAVWSLVRGRDLRGALWTGGIGALLGAPAVLPMLAEARFQGTAGGLPDLSVAPDLALGIGNLAGWLVPKVMLYDRDLGLGTVLGVGAIAALLLRRDPPLRRLALFAAVLVLAGTRLPGARWLLAPLTLLTHPVNLVYPALALTPLAVLGAAGLERLVAMRGASRERRLLGGAAATLLFLACLRAVLGGLYLASAAAAADHAVALLQAVLVLGALAVLVRRGPSATPLLVALALLDLGGFALRAHLAVPSLPLLPGSRAFAELPLLAGGYLDAEDVAHGFDAAVSGGEGPVLRRRAERVQANEEEVVAYEIEAPQIQARLLRRRFPVHAGMALGVRGLAGRSKVPPRRATALLRPLADQLAEREDPTELTALFTAEATGGRVLDVFGAGAAVWGDRVLAQRAQAPGACFLAAAVAVEADEGSRVARLLDRAGGRGPALLEAPLPEGLPLAPVPLGCESTGGAVRMTVQVPPGRRALVGIAVPAHPGWRAVEGVVAHEIVPVDQVRQAILLAPGTHQVAWSFRPPGLGIALGLAALGLLGLLGLVLGGGRARGPGSFRRPEPPMPAAPPPHPAGALCLLALSASLGFPAPVGAAPIEGVVSGVEPGSTYTIWLTSSLDLSEPGQPLVTADVAADGRFRLETAGSRLTPAAVGERGASPSDESWLFLRQESLGAPTLDGRPGPPLVLYRPLDLLPFPRLAPPVAPRFTAVPAALARLRSTGSPAPGWWRPPLLAALLLFAGAPLLRRRLLRGSRGATLRPGQAAPLPPAPPRLFPRRERWLLGALLLLALLLRLPGIASDSLDFDEWSYGPGTERVVPLEPGEVPTSWWERARTDPGLAWADLRDAALHPACLELVHPPLWHLLSGALGALSGGAAWALRAPSLLLSLATVLLLHLLLRPLDPRVGLVAAGAFAVAPPALHFGRDATPYALLSLLAVATPLLIVRALRRGTVGAHAAWLGVLVLGFLSHYAAAFLGLGLGVALVTLAWIERADRRWALAAAPAVRAAVLVLPPALAWSALHFANFGAIALDTRLYADSYPLDPGLLPFLRDFVAVGLGVPPALWPLALLPAGLVLLGVHALTARSPTFVASRVHGPEVSDPVLAALLTGSALAFVFGAVFFHRNLVTSLDGHVFWGFRWVSWFLPAGVALAAVGAVRGAGPRVLRVAALGAWGLTGLVAPHLPPFASTHPDYAGAAAIIAADLQDRDAVAALPMWGQSGPLRSALLAGFPEARLTTIHDTTAYDVGGRALYLEAIDERFPLQTSARNAHLDRLWLVVPDERMFGREKFRGAVVAGAIAWADRAMRRERTIELKSLRLLLYVRGPAPTPPTEPLPLDALRALPWVEPNVAPCGPDDLRWAFSLRWGGELQADAEPPARIDRLPSPAGAPLRARVEGGPCDGPAPRVRFGVH